MTPTVYIMLAVQALQLAFFAGGAWFLVRQMRRDLNGLGAKMNGLGKTVDRKFMAICVVALEQTQDPKVREAIASRILDAMGGG
jgi:hypothetical protein